MQGFRLRCTCRTEPAPKLLTSAECPRRPLRNSVSSTFAREGLASEGCRQKQRVPQQVQNRNSGQGFNKDKPSKRDLGSVPHPPSSAPLTRFTVVLSGFGESTIWAGGSWAAELSQVQYFKDWGRCPRLVTSCETQAWSITDSSVSKDPWKMIERNTMVEQARHGLYTRLGHVVTTVALYFPQLGLQSSLSDSENPLRLVARPQNRHAICFASNCHF